MTNSQYETIKTRAQRIRISLTVRHSSDDLLVFMHGFGCAKEIYKEAFSTEALSDFSICAFDFPGHGKSDRSDRFNYSLEEYADVANAIIDKLAPRRVYLVCHSMGAAVGLIAAQERNDLKLLINVDGNLVEQDCGIVSRQTADQPPEAFINYGFQRFLQSLQTATTSDLRAWAVWYEQADPQALHEIARSLVDWSDSGKLLDMFCRLDCKAYIYGEREPKDYLLPQLTGLPVFRVSATGHFIMIDKQQAFYALVSDILRTTMTSTESSAPNWPRTSAQIVCIG